RMLHDLHRAATHANLPIQETPMSATVARVMGSRILNNALKHKPTTRAGLMVNGGGYQGKTETVCEIAAAFEDQWLDLHNHVNPHMVPGTRDLLATVAYVQTPVTATPKSICQAIQRRGGHPDRTTLRPGRPRPVPLRHPRDDRGVGDAPGRYRGPPAATARRARHAHRRHDARVPVSPHQRHRRPAGAPDRGR